MMSSDPELDERIKNKFIRNIMKPYGNNPYMDPDLLQEENRPEPIEEKKSPIDENGIFPTYKIEKKAWKQTPISMTFPEPPNQNVQCSETAPVVPRYDVYYIIIILILLITNFIFVRLLFQKK